MLNIQSFQLIVYIIRTCNILEKALINIKEVFKICSSEQVTNNIIKDSTDKDTNLLTQTFFLECLR